MKRFVILFLVLAMVFLMFSCKSQEDKSNEELKQIAGFRKTDEARYMAELEAFIKKTPKELSTYKKAVALFVDGFKKLANGWIENGRYDQALEFIRQGLKYDEKNNELLELKKLCVDKGDVTEEEIESIARGMTDQDVVHILGNPMGGLEKKMDENQTPYYIMKYMIEMNPEKLVFISLNENKTVARIRYYVDKAWADEYPERKAKPVVPVEKTESTQ